MDVFIPIASPKPSADEHKIRAKYIYIDSHLTTPKRVRVILEAFPHAKNEPLDAPTQTIGEFSFDPVKEAAKDPRIITAMGLIDEIISERIDVWVKEQAKQAEAPKG
jgi:hypothetical protein